MKNIKKILCVGTFVGFAGLVSTAAQAESVVGQLAISDVDGGFDSGLALVVGYQVERPDLSPGLGFRGEFSTTISNPEDDFFGETLEVSYYTLAGYATYTGKIDDKLSAHGKLGLLYEDVEVDTSFGSESDTDLGMSFGFGATYELNKQMDFIAEYTIIEADISHLSAGINYRF